jgi:hypothetical protein
LFNNAGRNRDLARGRVMKRQCTLEEIHAEMQRRIDASSWAHGYCRDCIAPTPYRIPFDGVSNWTATVASTAKPGCESFLLEIVAVLRTECELEPETVSQSVERLLPWRGWASWRRNQD